MEGKHYTNATLHTDTHTHADPLLTLSLLKKLAALLAASDPINYAVCARVCVYRCSVCTCVYSRRAVQLPLFRLQRHLPRDESLPIAPPSASSFLRPVLRRVMLKPCTDVASGCCGPLLPRFSKRKRFKQIRFDAFCFASWDGTVSF